MNNTNQPSRAEQDNQSTKQPELIGYSVSDRGDGKNAIWTRVGAAWLHKDGKGYDLRLQALPVDGRLALRFRDKADDASENTVGTEAVPMPQQ